MEGHLHGECCGCSVAEGALTQTMSEMEFERGIWQAAMDGSVDRVRRLLENGTPPNVTDSATYTALHYASRNGHLLVVELLLNNGAAVNVQTSGGATPLHRAAYCGHVAVCERLLRKGADPYLSDSDGKIALHKAAEGGHEDIVCLLLETSRLPEMRQIEDNRMKRPVDYIPQQHANKQVLLELLT